MTAREGMATLIKELRRMAFAGTADYTLADETYWTDDHLQDILDRGREDVIHEELVGVTEYTGGAPFVKRHYSQHGNYESGEDVFYLEDSTGALIGTALYTPDYTRGVMTFASDTGGTVYYLTGRSYDLNAAAADVWELKAAHYAEVYDISTDGHSLKRSQLIEHCEKMAAKYREKARKNVEPITLSRDDANAWTY